MEIKINGNITINTGVTATQEATTDAVTPSSEAKVVVDHSKDVLISNDTTFNELIRILAKRPEVIAAAEIEAAVKKESAKEEKLRKIYGNDYALVFEQKINKPKNTRRPGVVQLQDMFPRVAAIEVGNSKCEVYSNGYAVYDNGNRRAVIWVPDCSSTTYYFGKLKEAEKEYLKEQDEIGQDVMGEYPWHIALIIAGENRIEFNMEHPKSVGTMSEFDDGDIGAQKASRWYGGSHFDSPEEAFLKKEAEAEKRRTMTDKQREVYELYYEQGLSQREIAEILGVNHRAVGDRLKGLNVKMKKFF